jgi:hypothetical protein
MIVLVWLKGGSLFKVESRTVGEELIVAIEAAVEDQPRVKCLLTITMEKMDDKTRNRGNHIIKVVIRKFLVISEIISA